MIECLPIARCTVASLTFDATSQISPLDMKQPSKDCAFFCSDTDDDLSTPGKHSSDERSAQDDATPSPSFGNDPA